MEEGEYRNTYHNVNQQRCLFEKSILSRRAACHHAHRFCLADREGIACQHKHALDACSEVLDTLRSKAIFALQRTHIDGPLPHASEMKLQLGGLSGMQRILGEQEEPENRIDDISGVIGEIIDKFGTIDALPYNEIARAITQYQGRKSRKLSKG